MLLLDGGAESLDGCVCVHVCVYVCVHVCVREREGERAELSSSGVGGQVCVSMLIINQVQIVKFSGCSDLSAK